MTSNQRCIQFFLDDQLMNQTLTKTNLGFRYELPVRNLQKITISALEQISSPGLSDVK